MKHATKAILMLAPAMLLGGCAGNLKERNEKVIDEASQVIQQRQAAAREAVLDAEKKRRQQQEVSRPYVAGLSVPLSREATMPENLRASVPVTAFFASAPVDLQTALRQLSQTTGMNIVATPDALMPASMFGPKTNVANSPVTAPPSVMLRANATPIWKVLDEIASQIQANWRPTTVGAEFYRVETRSYELMTIASTASTSASLGRSGGGGGTAFTNDSKTTFATKESSQLDGVKSMVESMLSTGGKFTLSPESQMLMVTDTPETHARVAEFVRKQNKAMSRRVRMLVEAIEVVGKEGSEFSLDWSLVYNTTSTALTGASPTSLATGQAGVVNLGAMLGPLSGSSVVVKALNEIGTVVNRRVFPVVTTSGRPITQALRSTFNYVDQVQTTSIASSTNTVAQAPTVTQKDETVGTLLTLVPTAKSDGSVFLSVSYDVTSAEPLRPYTVGNGTSAVTVQQKTINGSGMVQEVPVRSGRTEVIGGIEMMTTQNTTRRLGDGAPIILGGSNSANNSKSVMVLLVTAVTEEGI